jgi:hypothetical protein
MSATSAPHRMPRWLRTVVAVLATLVIAVPSPQPTDRSSLRNWHVEWVRPDPPHPEPPAPLDSGPGSGSRPGPGRRRGRPRLPVSRAVRCSCRSRTP